MAAVRADDAVLVGQVLADTDGDGLHARIEMREARDLARLELDAGPFLELAQQPQAAVGAQQSVMGHRCRSRRVRDRVVSPVPPSLRNRLRRRYPYP